MTRIALKTSFVAFFLVAVVNCAAAQGDYDRLACLARCEGGIQGCLIGAAAASETRERDLKARAIEERKKITCTTAQGNVQRCVQHGQDLLSGAVNFKGGGNAVECEKEKVTCYSNCSRDGSSILACESLCEGGMTQCLRGAAVAAEIREKDLKARAIEERKKITCATAQGNVQHCVQHGQDLLSGAVNFKGGGNAIGCNKEYDTCRGGCK
jgi:hypothetical protein